MHATPSKMGTGVNILEKNLWGQKSLILEGRVLLWGRRSIFQGEGSENFREKWKIALSQYKNQLLSFTLNESMYNKEFIRCIRITH